MYVRAVSICLLFTSSALITGGTERIIVHSDGIERVYSAEDFVVRNGNQAITMSYNFSQRSFIENNQTNTVHTPPAPAPPPEPTPPTFTEMITMRMVDFVQNPLAIGACACIAYAFYYLKSKFSLYNLSKACIEKAIWSLWKSKTSDDEIVTSENIDSALLVQILHTYDTDNYTTAVACFLQDVEQESELLTAFIREAENAQKSILRFLFDDFSEHIIQAREKLEILKHLKTIVMGWLGSARPSSPDGSRPSRTASDRHKNNV